ncbi:MAG TPA: hypothetical protein VLA92_04100, partial [Candidatus Saccharimonadales bacterium]|nr:hypothetical protein [Candidatus Saccharimonadales bacterium]
MSFLKSFFGGDSQSSLTGSKTVLDMVTSTAALASNTLEIDPMLDSVRSITSRNVPGQALSASDEDTLLGVYLRLEAYLTTKEPIRTFTKEELRARLAPELLQRLSLYEAKK